MKLPSHTRRIVVTLLGVISGVAFAWAAYQYILWWSK
jgi:hypothetical protein